MRSREPHGSDPQDEGGAPVPEAFKQAAAELGITYVEVGDGFAFALDLVLQQWQQGVFGPDLVEPTLRHVAAHARPETATVAAFNLGLLLDRRGAVDEARAAYEQAVRGVGEAAALAATNLGAMLENTDPDRAAELFVIGMTSDDPHVAIGAAFGLGLARWRLGDRAEAVAPTRRAIDDGDELTSAKATLLMGVLLHELGDVAGGAWCFAKAARWTDYPQVADQAATFLRGLPPIPEGPTDDPDDDARLGLQLEHEGDIEGAAAAYIRADLRGSGDGASNIGFFRLNWNEPHLAEECYRRADERGSRNGSFRLGLMLHQRGELAAAERAYARGAARGSWVAAGNLGCILFEREDLAGARQAFRQALRDCPDPSKLDDLRTWVARCGEG